MPTPDPIARLAEQAVRELVEIAAMLNHDPEAAHSAADDVIIRLLRSIDLCEVADAWEAVEKWYA